ncbi:hypothetical protein ACFLSU_04695 [Bacteroidota bacterium]
MKKLLLLLTITLFVACSSNKETIDDIPVFPLTNFQKILDEYGLLNTGRDFQDVASSVDKTKIVFFGINKASLNLTVFDKETKLELYSLTSLKTIDTIVSIDEGFGEITERKADFFDISAINPVTSNNTQFVLNGFNKANQKDGQFGELLYSHLYFFSKEGVSIIKNKLSKEKIHYFEGIHLWHDDTVIIKTFNSRQRIESYFCYKTNGDFLFDCKVPRTPIHHINYEEYIAGGNGGLYRRNIKTDDYIWSVSLFPEFEIGDYNEKYRVDDSKYTVEGTTITSDIKYTLADGEAKEKTLKHNIDTGKIIE